MAHEIKGDLNVLRNIVSQNGYIELNQISAPGSPTAGGRLYQKTGSESIFWHANGGDEVDLTNGFTSGAIYVHEQTSGSLNWNINHNLNTTKYSITVFNGDSEVYLPNTITTVDADNILIENSSAISGSAVIIGALTSINTVNTQYVHTQSSGETTWSINHSLDTVNYNIDIFDASGNLFIPVDVKTIDSNNIEIVNGSPRTGKAVIFSARAGAFLNQNLNAESIEKSSITTNNYLQMSNNSVTLTAGTWQLNGAIEFGNNGSSPSYTGVTGIWATANGADTSSEPTTLQSSLSAGFYRSSQNGLSNASTVDLVAQTARISVTSDTTVYLVPFVLAGTASNARVKTYIYAERIQ